MTTTTNHQPPMRRGHRNPLDDIGTSLHAATDIARWRAGGWWPELTLGQFFLRATERFADHTALVGITASERADAQLRAAARPRRYRYRDVYHLASAVARSLEHHEVAPGDTVLLHLPNTVDYVVGFAGTVLHGAVPVCALHTCREGILARLGAHAGARYILSAAEHTPLDPATLHRHCQELGVPPLQVITIDVADDGPGAHPSDTATAAAVTPAAAQSAAVGVVQLSGGTTGLSKLIPRTHAGYIYASSRQAELAGLTEASALLVVLPAAHNFPMTSPGIIGAWSVGAAVVMCPDPSPATAFPLITEQHVTHLSLVPPLAQAWLDAAARRTADFSSLRVVGIGGARLAPAVAEKIEPVFGGRLQQIYGMAEGLANFTRLDDPAAVRVGTQGRPICPGDDIRIVSESGDAVPPGEEGELHTRGPYTITRYLGDSLRERAAFTADGYYRTGDLVRLTADGNLQVTGRLSDSINRAGETLSAAAIEDEVLAHPHVRDAVAVGIPDDTLGEALVVAVVVRDIAQSAPDLRSFLRHQGLPDYMLPDFVVTVDSLPATGVGKNSRQHLQQHLAAQIQGAIDERPPHNR